MTGNRTEVLGTTVMPQVANTMMEMVYPRHPDQFELSQSMDHTLPSESFVQEFSYNPSPDSLSMYEQERHADTLSYPYPPSVDTPMFTSCHASLCLPPLEQSDIYSMSSDMDVGDNSEETGSDLGQMNWDIKDMDFVKIEDVLQDSSDVNQGPTLSELNSFIGDNKPLKSNQRKTMQILQSAVPASINTEQWNTGVLEDWTSLDSNRCSPVPSISKQGFATFSNSKTWNNNSFSQGTVIAGSTDEGNCSSFGNIQEPMIKQEPGFKSESPCLHQQSRFQNSSKSQTISHQDQTRMTSLHSLLLQDKYGHQTSGSASPPVPPPEHRVPLTATVCKPEPMRNSDNTMDQLWEEVKQYIHDEEKGKAMDASTVKIKRERLDSGSTVLTSMEEDMESLDSDNGEEEDLSDQDSSDSDEFESISPGASKTKEKQYFWQYNVQSKGPKGKKLCLTMDTVDPHVLPNFEDPVFDPDYKVPGISHGGKARRGDGNNVFPNPKKLCQIGNELKKLNRRISEYGPLNDMPSAVRNKSRKEKNKLASRACRLKKKAQHEANKVKLMGLEQEHSQLMTVISLIKSDTLKRLSKVQEEEENLSGKLEEYISTHIKRRIAGKTTEFVNEIIQTVNSPDSKDTFKF